ncbi:RHS repeat-associated core domain-containing protein [Endozoicomonas sp. ALC013]|uniref:RHS repeat-associated core domain-containing protein n=1 Tax=Endozoicomonas sp. ALC013 TaxID=3403076 RepID=UPI003BB69170
MAWNARGLMLSATDPLGRTTRIQYDDLGRPVKTLRPDGQSSTVVYDELDRVVAATDALNQTTKFSYDAAGRLLTVTDAAGGVTAFQYDQYGRQISETRPDGSAITHTYRADNLLASSTDPRGIETTYQYDAAKRLIRIDAQGEITQYTYDANGRMLSATNPESQLSWSYDKAGHTLQETADGRTIALQYNAESEPVEQTIAGETLSYAWDKRGLIAGMTSPDGTHTFNWDAIGQMKGINYPNGRTSNWDYDAAGQLTRQNYTDVAGIDYGYEYNSNGLLTQRTGDGAQWSYQYDAIDRLVSATHGAETYNYQYDALGNRQEAGQQYDAFNKLLEDSTHTYQYDAAGNLVKKISKADNRYETFGYNHRGRLVRFEAFAAGATTPATIAEYAHDALGRRVLKTVNGTATRFQWQGNSIVAEYDSNDTLTKQYRYALGFAPLQYKTTEGVYDVHADQLSTPRAMTDQAGSTARATSLSPYGVADITRGESLGFNIRFPGQYADGESGLYYNRFRDYAPGSGRYVQSDPIGLLGGVNLFVYGLANPISQVDLYGLWSFGVEAYLGIGGGVNVAYSGGTLEVTGRLGVGIGGGASIDPYGTPSPHSEACGSGYIARTSFTASAGVGYGPVSRGVTASATSGNAITTPVGGWFTQRSDWGGIDGNNTMGLGARLGVSAGVEIGSYSNW